MYLLLSGEGSGDIGICNSGFQQCDSEQFKYGPMSIIVDQMVEANIGYEFSHITSHCVSFVSEKYLADNKPPRNKKSISLRGKKKPAETKYFYTNARALAIAAKQKAEDIDDKVIAVLFRDSDGTASAGRGLWQDKWNSMIKGFEKEDFEFGVPMIPKPKSEAWLLCAVKDNPYLSCGRLENESGNDNAPNPLKSQLSDALNGNSSTVELNELLNNKEIDVHQIEMSSFNMFKERLGHVVNLITAVKPEL